MIIDTDQCNTCVSRGVFSETYHKRLPPTAMPLSHGSLGAVREGWRYDALSYRPPILSTCFNMSGFVARVVNTMTAGGLHTAWKHTLGSERHTQACACMLVWGSERPQRLAEPGIYVAGYLNLAGHPNLTESPQAYGLGLPVLLVLDVTPSDNMALPVHPGPTKVFDTVLR